MNQKLFDAKKTKRLSSFRSGRSLGHIRIGHTSSQKLHRVLPNHVQLHNEINIGDNNLAVNHPGDKYEREADQLALEVMKEPLNVDKQNMAHSKARRQRAYKMTILPTHSRVEQDGQSLSQDALDFFETRFGHDFSRVRIYANDQSDKKARTLNARAFTVGPNIFFRHGQYSKETTYGRRLLAHELAHVIQQGYAKPFIAKSRDGLSDASSFRAAKAISAPIHVQRDLLGTVAREGAIGLSVSGGGDVIEVHTRSIPGWRNFLENASDARHALELNIFMALALGSPLFYAPVFNYAIPFEGNVYYWPTREDQSNLLHSMTQPGPYQCVGLAAALLTTPNINLPGAGESAPYIWQITAELLPRFMEEYYLEALNYIQERAGEQYAVWSSITERGVARFGGEVSWLLGGLSRPFFQGEASEEPVLHQAIQAQALSMTAVIIESALGEAMLPDAAGHTIGEAASRRIKLHVAVIYSLNREQREMTRLTRQILSIAVDASFAVAGPLVGGLRIYSGVSSQAARLSVAQITSLAALVSGSLDGLKNITKSVLGLTAPVDVERNVVQVFDDTLQRLVDQIRSENGEVPEAVGEVIQHIGTAFLISRERQRELG